MADPMLRGGSKRADAPGREPGPRAARQRRRARRALVVLGAGALLLFFFPSGWAVNRLNVQIWLLLTPTPDLRSTVTPDDVGDLFNALAFIPLAAAASLSWPRVRTWCWCLAGLCCSSGIEVIQLLFLPERKFDPRDILCNTIGGILGALVAVALRARARRADRRVQAGRAPSGSPADQSSSSPSR